MGSKIKLGRADYASVVDLARKGCSEATIAESLWVSPRTFRDLKQRDPELVEALEMGRAHLHDELVSLLVQRAREGDLTALIFACKSILGFRDRGEAPNSVAAVNVQIQLPDSLTREEFARAVEVKALPAKEAGDE